VEGKQFKVLGTVSGVSFANDIKPLFTSYGCAGCHPSQGNLSVSSVSALLAGGNNGPAIMANNANGSNLVKKLRAETVPFGSKMPANGGHVSDTDLQKIKDWINQGALNN
jgi:cytochrome c551/c552